VAKSTIAPAKPLESRGYKNLILVTLIAIGLGCALMGYEIFVEYGGAVSAPKGPAVKVPKNLPPAEKAAPKAADPGM
jgi:hypothetical protein